LEFKKIMSKKTSIIIGAIAIIIGISGWQARSFSQEQTAQDRLNELTKQLKSETNINPETCGTNECCLTYSAAIGYAEKAWSENLKNLTDQEKPTSAMVDEAYENLRTHECRLEYICRAVEYSGYASPDTVINGEITSSQIGTIPGCQNPEDMGALTTWGSFKNFSKGMWNYITFNSMSGGTAKVSMRFPDTFFLNGGLPFMPECMSDRTDRNRTPDFVTGRTNYEKCMAIMNSRFACRGGEENPQDCAGESIAFVELENALRKSNADQKARVFENKLSSIITKMITLQMHTEYFKTKLENLDQLYACYPSRCD
jgi:hypothetical protein